MLDTRIESSSSDFLLLGLDLAFLADLRRFLEIYQMHMVMVIESLLL